jgi:hypothetical protein
MVTTPLQIPRDVQGALLGTNVRTKIETFSKYWHSLVSNIGPVLI